MQVYIISKNRGSNVKKYLLKHTDNKEKNLKYDFLPAIIEIVEKPANIWGTVIIIFSLFLFITVFVWAYFARFDVVVTAPGMINSREEIVKVEAMTGGQVYDIEVEEGEYVEEGRVLVKLDTNFIDEEIENLKHQLKILEIQKEIYTKISEGEDITEIDPEEYGDKKWLVEALIEEEKLYQITMKEYRRQENLETDTTYVQYEKESYELSRKTEIAQSISQCELQIWQYEKELATYEANRDFCTICANASGYVTKLQVLSKEEVVSAGELIAYIVDKEELVFECYVPDSEIANLEMGQQVNVKINTYPYNDYGIFTGEIVDISDISVQNETYGNVYVVDVLIENSEKTPFIIGMSGTAEIVTGKRSVLEYFMEPIKQGIDDSFKEK